VDIWRTEVRVVAAERMANGARTASAETASCIITAGMVSAISSSATATIQALGALAGHHPAVSALGPTVPSDSSPWRGRAVREVPCHKTMDSSCQVGSGSGGQVTSPLKVSAWHFPFCVLTTVHCPSRAVAPSMYVQKIPEQV